MANPLSSLVSVLARWASACLVASAALAQLPFNSNLLQNPDFETGTGGWTVNRGTFGVKQYGQAVAPPLWVGAAIGGGAQFVHLVFAPNDCAYCEGYAILEQSFDLSGNAALVDQGVVSVRLYGAYGGATGSNARCVLRSVYLNSAGAVLSVPFVDPTLPHRGQTSRNNESTMMSLSEAFPIPGGARTLKIQLVAYNGSTATWGGGGEAWADNLGAELVNQLSITPLPLGQNLLDVSTFEGDGVINPHTVNGHHVVRGRFGQKLYGGPSAPPSSVAAVIGGQSKFAWLADGPNDCAYCEGYGILRRSLDVTGHATSIDQGIVSIKMSGCFGGIAGSNARSALRASYFNASGGALSIPFVDPTLQYVGQVERNNESVLVAVEGTFALPAGTRRVEVDLVAWNGSSATWGAAADAWADNLSAMLLLNPVPSTPPVGANLIDNGGFEIGAIINPPAATGWRVTRGTLQAQPYGLPGLPFPSVSAAIGGGAFLARATSDSGGRASMTQTFDVRGHASMIDASQLSVQLDGHLGGPAGDSDGCSLDAYYYSDYGALLGQNTVGPVTQAERNNLATLLFRRGTFLLPVGTRRLVIEANFLRNGSTNDGFLDNVRVALVPSGIAVRFPGTADDLTLRTGVNALPSGGPGRDLKFASAFDIVSFEVRSPAGTLHWLPLFLGGNSFASTGVVPGLGLPSVHVNPFVPGFFWLLDGITPVGPFGAPVVIPGGNQMSFVVPPGLAGYSLLMQSLTLSVTATNGIYAATDAHEIRFQ